VSIYYRPTTALLRTNYTVSMTVLSLKRLRADTQQCHSTVEST